MTDVEIVNALKGEIRIGEHIDGFFADSVSLDLLKNILALIERQKAEIERLRNRNEIFETKTKEINNLLDTGLSIRSYNCLVRAGVTDLAQLSDWTKEDLRHVRNLGQRRFKEVIEVCHSKGIYLKDERNHDDGSGLLPCPFCGRENVFMHKSEYSGTYYIHCADCQTLFKMDCTAGHDYDKQRLKDNWNRRAKL